jgi:hypothetical protein
MHLAITKSNLGLTKLGFLVVAQLLTRHNSLMTTYLIVAKWGPMTLSEEMDITSGFNTEDEITVKELSHS